MLFDVTTASLPSDKTSGLSGRVSRTLLFSSRSRFTRRTTSSGVATRLPVPMAMAMLAAMGSCISPLLLL